MSGGLVAFGAAAGAVRPVLARIFDKDQIDVVGDRVYCRDSAADHVAVLILGVVILAESKADAMAEPAVSLSFDREPVADYADIGYAGVSEHLRLSVFWSTSTSATFTQYI